MAHQEQEDQAAIRKQRLLWLGIWLLLAFSAAQFLWELPRMFNYRKVDFAAYYHAARLVKEGRQSEIYTRDLANYRELGYPHEVTPYLYPPPLAGFLAPMTKLDLRTAGRIWFVVQSLLLIHSAWLLLNLPGRKADRLTAAIFVLVLLNYGPVVGDLLVGNINLLVLWLAVCALHQTLRGREGIAGALLGAAVVIKITPVALLAYYLFARRLRALAGAAAVVAGLSLLSLLILGFEPFHLFLEKFRELSLGTAYYSNISLNGFLRRLFETTDETIAPFPSAYNIAIPAARVIGMGIFAVSLILVWLRRSDVHYCFAVLACAMSLASPVTWPPHLLILLPSLLWLLQHYRAVLAESPKPARIAGVTVIGIVISALLIVTLPAAAQWPARGLVANVWLARALFGLLVLWAVLIVEGILLWRGETNHDARNGRRTSRQLSASDSSQAATSPTEDPAST